MFFRRGWESSPDDRSKQKLSSEHVREAITYFWDMAKERDIEPEDLEAVKRLLNEQKEKLIAHYQEQSGKTMDESQKSELLEKIENMIFGEVSDILTGAGGFGA